MSEFTWSPSHSDIMRGFRKATEVLQTVASPEAVYAASVAMTGETSKDAGYRAYHLALFASSDSDAQSAATDAFTTALAESHDREAAKHAERIAREAEYAAQSDADDSDADDSDADLFDGGDDL